MGIVAYVQNVVLACVDERVFWIEVMCLWQCGLVLVSRDGLVLTERAA